MVQNSKIKNIILESLKNILIEKIVDPRVQFINEDYESPAGNTYTHLAVNKQTNLIVYGWDYSDVEPSDLKQFKRDYFSTDLEDYGFNPRYFKIVTSNFAKKNGITQWSNSGLYPLSEENKMRQEGIEPMEKAHEERPEWFINETKKKKTNVN